MVDAGESDSKHIWIAYLVSMPTASDMWVWTMPCFHLRIPFWVPKFDPQPCHRPAFSAIVGRSWRVQPVFVQRIGSTRLAKRKRGTTKCLATRTLSNEHQLTRTFQVRVRCERGNQPHCRQGSCQSARHWVVPHPSSRHPHRVPASLSASSWEQLAGLV